MTSHTVALSNTESRAASAVTSPVGTGVHAVRWGALIALLFAVFGIVARMQILVDGWARPQSGNIFYRLYALFEAPFLLLILASAIVMLVLVARGRRASAAPAAWSSSVTMPTPRAVLVIAAMGCIATLLTTYFVLRAYPFSMDEFSADFQARIFARGDGAASLPGVWRPFAMAMTPIFVSYNVATSAWFSAYLPVYALLKTPFVALEMGGALNPLLAAAAIIALGGVGRRLWPNERLRPWLAVGFLVTSSQFIITSGSAYSMPAHLCFNLVWLWLYLRGDSLSFAAALGVGVLALGLHNPFPHALFVAPFLIRLARDHRWRRVAAATMAYGSASLFWYFWLRQSHALAVGAAGSGLLDVFALPNRATLWLHGINFSLLFTWQAPLFGMLVVAALLQANRLSAPLRDLGWGVALTLFFYLFFPLTQGHGWGYRYAYQVIGSLALLAAAGAVPLRDALGRPVADRLLMASFGIAVVMQLPVRLSETAEFVRPFAAGAEYVRTRNADVVLVHGDSIWYGRDLIRNDPFLRGVPVVLRAGMISPFGRSELERLHPGRVIEISDTEFLRLGMTPWTNHSY